MDNRSSHFSGLQGLTNKKTFALFLGILFLIVLVIEAESQSKIKNLYFNSSSNITRLQFKDTTILTYTGNSSGTTIGDSEGIAHAEDKMGETIFRVNAGIVYDRMESQMPSSTGLLADPSNTEIVICPFPSDSLKYYIIYNEQLCSKLYFSTINMRLRNGLGDVESINNLIHPLLNFAEGLEIIRIPCTNNFWLVAYQCNIGFMKFKIDENGISSPIILTSYDNNNNGGRGELDYHNGKIGYATTFRNKAFFADFDPLNGNFKNEMEVIFPAKNGMYGLEFSPDASKAYLTDWDNRDFAGNFSGPNLFSYDFNTSLISSYSILNKGKECGSADVRGLGQIELAADNKLYIPHVGGCQITVIENANSINPVFSTIDVNSILSPGVSDPVQSDIFPPIMMSKNKEICKGDSILLEAKGGQNYKWFPSLYVSNPLLAKTYAKPEINTVYKVISEDNYGCLDSGYVSINVNSVPQVNLGNDISICELSFITLDEGNKGLKFEWSNSSTSSAIKATPGKHWVNVFNKNCKTSDTIEIYKISPLEIFIPNLIITNNDEKNETFEIIGYQGDVEVSIFNRWGKQVFFSEDYKGNWRGENVSEGLFYYQLKYKNGCQMEKNGWVEIIK